MKILVTGATGFLGQHLVRRLLAEGHQLVLFVRQKSKALALFADLLNTHESQICFVEGIITDSSVEQIPHVDAIYHSAALLSFDPAKKDAMYQTNVLGTKALLETAKRMGSPQFFYISTAFTLGEHLSGQEQLYSTDRPFVNEYERTKCLAEHLVFSYGALFPVHILRPSIIIGDSRTGAADTAFGLYGLIRSLELLQSKVSRHQGRDGHPHVLLCEKKVTSNLVPVDYVTDVLVTALDDADANTIYNVTNPAPPLQGEIFELIKERLAFPDLHIHPYSYTGDLSRDSLKINAALSVFRSYWSRSIHFDSANTRMMMEQAGRRELAMDHDALRFIIQSGALSLKKG